MNNEIMTLSEVSKYLKISEKTVLRMVKKGEIPVTKVASQWRFMKAVINDWLISRMEINPKSETTLLLEKSEIQFNLSLLIKPEMIIHNIIPGNKEFILNQLCRPLSDNKIIKDKDLFIKLLMERENLYTTAVCKWAAIPHARNPKHCPVTDTVVVIGICKDGVDFNSIDGDETFIFFLICTNSEIIHLRILSKIVEFAKDLDALDLIINSHSKESVISSILKWEVKNKIS
ncbi:MAG: PTS sugar transporter subunit IIA [Spirochaetes bacterium]|nr:PTS sugar transporter subunit IIA [Spirochaetota bacterium]